MDTKLNPLLEVIVKISECARRFEEEYAPFMGYDGLKVLQAENPKNEARAAIMNFITLIQEGAAPALK